MNVIDLHLFSIYFYLQIINNCDLNRLKMAKQC